MTKKKNFFVRRKRKRRCINNDAAWMRKIAGRIRHWTRVTSWSRRAAIIIRERFIERRVSLCPADVLVPLGSRTQLFAPRCHRCLGQPYPFAHTTWPRWTSKKPNPVYQPTDPPSPPLVTYSVTADDQDDFDSPLVRSVLPREWQRCIKVMIRRVVKEEHVKILISRYSRIEIPGRRDYQFFLRHGCSSMTSCVT